MLVETLGERELCFLYVNVGLSNLGLRILVYERVKPFISIIAF